MSLIEKEKTLENRLESADKKSREIEEKLESVSRLSQDEAKDLLMKYTEERYEKDIMGLIEKKKKDLKTRELEATREILIKSIQQYA